MVEVIAARGPEGNALEARANSGHVRSAPAQTRLRSKVADFGRWSRPRHYDRRHQARRLTEFPLANARTGLRSVMLGWSS
jgi:hypothetical protein